MTDGQSTKDIMRDPLSDDELDLDPIEELVSEAENRLTKPHSSTSRSTTKAIKKPLSVWQKNIKLPFTSRNAVANDGKLFKNIPRCLKPTGKTINTCSDGFVGSERHVRDHLPIVRSLRRPAVSSIVELKLEPGALPVRLSQAGAHVDDPDGHSMAFRSRGTTTPVQCDGDTGGDVERIQDENHEAMDVDTCMVESSCNTEREADMSQQCGFPPTDGVVPKHASKRKVTLTETRIRMQLSNVTAPLRPKSEASYHEGDCEMEDMSDAATSGGDGNAHTAEHSGIHLSLNNASGEPPTLKDEREERSICLRRQVDRAKGLRPLSASRGTVLYATDDILDDGDCLTVPGQAVRMQSSGLWIEVEEQIDDDSSPNRASCLQSRSTQASVKKMPPLQLARSTLNDINHAVSRRQPSAVHEKSPITTRPGCRRIQERQESVDLGESSIQPISYNETASAHWRHQPTHRTPTLSRPILKPGSSQSLRFRVCTDNHIQCLQPPSRQCTMKTRMETLMTSF